MCIYAHVYNCINFPFLKFMSLHWYFQSQLSNTEFIIVLSLFIFICSVYCSLSPCVSSTSQPQAQAWISCTGLLSCSLYIHLPHPGSYNTTPGQVPCIDFLTSLGFPYPALSLSLCGWTLYPAWTLAPQAGPSSHVDSLFNPLLLWNPTASCPNAVTPSSDSDFLHGLSWQFDALLTLFRLCYLTPCSCLV